MFVGGAVFIIVDVTNDDSEGVGAADWWAAAVTYDHWDVILLESFAVECLQTRYNAGPVTVVTAACITYNSIYTRSHFLHVPGFAYLLSSYAAKKLTFLPQQN